MRRIVQSKKLQHVRYDVRGPILVEAHRLEAEGHKILKLNIGNTAPFGFEAPESIVADMVHNLPDSQGYADSRGIYSARTAVAQYYQSHGLTDTGVDDVYIGNGVSELISMVLQAFVDDGNEILVPAPDYPLWTACVNLAGGTAVHYVCDEQSEWYPDMDDMRAKITDRTKAIVIINPNNPTGALYPREVLQQIVDIAREHQLIIFSDEIYDRLVMDGLEHISIASMALSRRRTWSASSWSRVSSAVEASVIAASTMPPILTTIAWIVSRSRSKTEEICLSRFMSGPFDQPIRPEI